MNKPTVVGWNPAHMKRPVDVKIRNLNTSLGKAVANRTILRPNEKWKDVAERVAIGNTSLIDYDSELEWVEEINTLYKHVANGSLLMSGRHLQHGDKAQKSRNMEIFTNCSTASASFILFYLLLNGSGVGRAYDDDMMVVDWKEMPDLKLVLRGTHPDYEKRFEKATDLYPETHRYFLIPDSREGWAQAVEIIETMAFEGSKNKTLVLDFSVIRPKGSPIGGMQNRPCSGPIPLMEALEQVATVKNEDWSPWKQTMYVDHYLAECVLVGGARRAARIVTKVWTDPEILEYVSIKQAGGLWSANNSVAVDEEFWKQDTEFSQVLFEKVAEASYYDDTGEPGFINQHKLVQNDLGYDGYKDGEYAVSDKYKPLTDTKKLLSTVAIAAAQKPYSQITNPCGEITLNMLGGYCVIADVVPYFCPDLKTAEESFRAATRALIRVNTMNSLYDRETKRTNRIGVGMTGIHEFAWNAFGYGFKDLIDEKKSQDFWNTLARFKEVVEQESKKYSKKLGLVLPHTNTTIKPAGTTSKLFALSEGAHLPSMREYIRWVQFRNDDPLIKKYQDYGYPIKILETYKGTTVVGFPTQPEICKLDMGANLVTAAEATPEEQYKWLMLLEKYWIRGLGQGPDRGNQVSYTLKYKKKLVSFENFKEMMLKYQSQIRCCSVMPQTNGVKYEYVPEEAVSSEEFVDLVESIHNTEIDEQIDLEHLKCENGACPI